MKSENGNVKADESLHGVGEELTTPGRSHLSSTLPPSASRVSDRHGDNVSPVLGKHILSPRTVDLSFFWIRHLSYTGAVWPSESCPSASSSSQAWSSSKPPALSDFLTADTQGSLLNSALFQLHDDRLVREEPLQSNSWRNRDAQGLAAENVWRKVGRLHVERR